MARIRTLAPAAAAMLAAAVTALAAEPAGLSDADALRTLVGSRICRVVARNDWGVPLGLANGFLLGNGKFVVTDLGVVAQGGVTQVELKFQDGSRGVAKQFALASPASGLVAVCVEGTGLPGREGLSLAKGAAVIDGRTSVWAAGWKWGTDLDFVTGVLIAGPTIKDLAARPVEGGPPPGTVARMTGGHLAAASGAPVTDAQGTVVAVRQDVLLQEMLTPVAVPASLLREAMLGATPEVKPLADLPKSMYLPAVFRMPGEPGSAQALAALARTIRTDMTCTRCRGTGEIQASAVMQAPRSSSRPHGNWRPPRDWNPPRDWRPPQDAQTPQDARDRKVECPDCRGEKVICTEPVYMNLAKVAEECTRAAWAPNLAGLARQGARAEGIRLLAAVAQAGPRFRGECARQTSGDLRRVGGDLQRGVIAAVQVRETVDGPDGRYTLLESNHSRTMMAIRAASVDRVSAVGALGNPKDPKAGTWIVIGGVAQAQFDVGANRVAFILPFGWVPLPEP